MLQHFKNQRGFTLAELMIVVGFVLWLATVCGIGYVAWHFIAKYW